MRQERASSAAVANDRDQREGPKEEEKKEKEKRDGNDAVRFDA